MFAPCILQLCDWPPIETTLHTVETIDAYDRPLFSMHWSLQWEADTVSLYIVPSMYHLL